MKSDAKYHITSRQNVDTPTANRQRDRTCARQQVLCRNRWVQILPILVPNFTNSGTTFYQFWALGPIRDASSIFFILLNINTIIIGRIMHGSSDIRLT